MHPARKQQRAGRIAYQQTQAQKGSQFVVDMWTPYPWTSGSTDDDWTVFQAVAKVYEGSIYSGSCYEIEKSWRRVTAALTRGEAWRYYPSKWLRYDESQLLSSEMDLAR
jgi:hypothetical protein